MTPLTARNCARHDTAVKIATVRTGGTIVAEFESPNMCSNFEPDQIVRLSAFRPASQDTFTPKLEGFLAPKICGERTPAWYAEKIACCLITIPQCGAYDLADHKALVPARRFNRKTGTYSWRTILRRKMCAWTPLRDHIE